MKFRIQSKQFFLTFPKSLDNNSLSVILDRIIEKEKHLKYAIIGKELHQDGTTHFHIFLRYSRKKDVSNSSYFNYITNEQGHYERASSIQDSIHYIKKDGNYLEGGKSNLSLKHRKEEIMIHIRDHQYDHNRLLESKDKQDSILLFQCGLQLDRFRQRVIVQDHTLAMSKRHHLIDFNGDLLYNTYASGNMLDAYHVLKPILQYLIKHHDPVSRHSKAECLLIGSNQPDTGKTALLNWIKSFAPYYQWPDDTGFQPYTNHLYQWIIGDEVSFLKGEHTFLNNFMAGNAMALSVKHSHSFKKDNPALLMASNFNLKYHVIDRGKSNPVILQALRTRVLEIELTCPIFHDYNLGYALMEEAKITKSPL